jgi:hypothetical protein
VAAGERGPFLVAQCWSRHLLSDIKLSPSDDEAPADVVLLHHLGLEDEQVARSVGGIWTARCNPTT